MELSPRSKQRLQGVHADLVRVVVDVARNSDLDFVVTEGLRTKQRQAKLMAAGATRTLKSRHLTGHAVDLAVRVGAQIRWDWPLYKVLADAMKASASRLSVPIEWGGDWRTFKDGPHFQLPWGSYPG